MTVRAFHRFPCIRADLRNALFVDPATNDDLTAVMLGSGGWMATPQRGTAAILVRSHESDLLLDAGTGVHVLARRPEMLGSSGVLRVILSHFHMDHVIGLTYLSSLLPDVAVEIWGAAKMLSESSTAEVITTLLSPPYQPSHPKSSMPTFHELSEGSNTVGTMRVEARIQTLHDGGSVGIRVEDKLTYITDTAPDPDSAAFACGSELLVHEAWSPEISTDQHSSAAAAAAVAARAGVKRLVLCHVHPLCGDGVSLLKAASPHFSATSVGRDGVDLM